MILTVEEFEARVSTGLDEGSVQSLLDAAETAITDILGPVGPVQEYHRASGDLIVLTRRADEITTVLEGTTELEDDDYELRADQQTVRRLNTGTNPASYWRGRTDWTYTPADDIDERARVQVELVKLELNHSPGLRRERIGDWEEEQAGAVEGQSYEQQRAAILASLGHPLVLL